MTNVPQSALIGHTGFVGSNLSTQRRYSCLFNSRNIGDLNQREYSLTVCAGVYALKWKANLDPEGDWKSIEILLETLARHVCQKFVLISTIDVYPNPNGFSEDASPAFDGNHAYGRHRLCIEQFVSNHFPDHHIVRLPGLFGPGLKKNVLFDLINRREMDTIQPRSTFQYYDLSRLADDLDTVVSNGIRILNVATEPIQTATILDRFFPTLTVGSKASPPVSYDFRSRHAGVWGRADQYLYSADTVMADFDRFLGTIVPSSQPQVKV